MGFVCQEQAFGEALHEAAFQTVTVEGQIPLHREGKSLSKPLPSSLSSTDTLFHCGDNNNLCTYLI